MAARTVAELTEPSQCTLNLPCSSTLPTSSAKAAGLLAWSRMYTAEMTRRTCGTTTRNGDGGDKHDSAHQWEASVTLWRAHRENGLGGITKIGLFRWRVASNCVDEDPTRAPTATATAAEPGGTFRGAALHHRATHHGRWRLHGADGSELRLPKG